MEQDQEEVPKKNVAMSRSQMRIERAKAADRKPTQSRSTFSFRKIIPQKEVDVYAVVTETTTTTERVKRKRKPQMDKVIFGSDDSFGSFNLGPHYYHLELIGRTETKITWMTTEIASQFPRTQKAVESALGELLIHLIFVIIVLIVILHMNVKGKYYYGHYLRHYLTGRPQDYGYGYGSDDILTFSEINTQRNMYRYLNDTFVRSEFMDHYYKRAFALRPLRIRDYHYILGSIRLRQFRMDNDTCTIPAPFKDVLGMRKCFGDYEVKQSDKKIILPNAAALSSQVGETFHADPFVYEEPELEYNYPITTQEAVYPGTGGFVAKYISGSEAKGGTKGDLDQDMYNSYLNTMLFAAGWIRRNTRVVIVDLLDYNPSVMMMGQAKIIFEYLPEGGIFPTLQLNIIRVYHLLTAMDYFILGCRWSIASFIILFFVEEVRELAYFGLKYFLRFWSWVDMCLIFAQGSVVAFTFRYITAFMAFAVFGYFLFGSYLETYSTFSLSCMAVVRFYFGYIQYDELVELRGAIGLFYVLVLVFYMVGYMMAFFLVVLLNYYSINEAETVIKRGTTAGGMLCSWCTRLKHLVYHTTKSGVLPVDNITTDELLDSLDILNFTDPEIDLFQMKYKLNEQNTSEPEYVSKILWNIIEEIRTDEKHTEDMYGAELEEARDETSRPLYAKQYTGLVRQMKNLEIQAEILLEKTSRCLTTIRIGRTMLQPPTIIKDERLMPPRRKY